MNSTIRATVWSLTINNPTEADEECIARARQKGWTVDGQREKGENGTPHYQLILKTPQVRFSAIKKAFPRAHIEVARNPAALEQYCHKSETKDGDLPTSSDKYPTLSKFWHLVYEYLVAMNWIDWSDGTPSAWWKEAFDDNDYPRFNYDKKIPLEVQQEFAQIVFEAAVASLISKGFHIEHFCNSQNISVFKKFHFQILRRSMNEINAQTDRQTDTASDGDDSILVEEHNPDVCPQVSLPTPQSPPSPPTPCTCPHCLQK